MDKIRLIGLRFCGRHGCYQQEREQEQSFAVTLELSCDTRKAAISDDLADSVDYAAVYLAVKNIVERESYNLLEALAERIAAAALSFKGVTAAAVTVEKEAARAGEDSFRAQVAIERSK
ncbi:MAG: dihydroneopterin aldolase [Bacillota bacterium]|nr:dihydroneopterin aldolase [Bacillota bacterium]